MRRLLFALALLLGAVLSTGLAHAQGAASQARIATMPLTEAPAQGGGDTFVVFYSGDGGWAPIDKGVAASLTRAGVPVVGVNSMRYFLTARTPDEAAGDLAALIEGYAAKWGKRHVIVAGFSFGANALPAIVPHLPATVRGRVRGVALISAEASGELRFTPGSWLNQTSKSTYPLAAALTRLKGLPMVCIYGDKDRDAGCGGFPADLIRPVRMAGDHHLNFAFADIAKTILTAQ